MPHHYVVKDAIALERFRDWGVYPWPWLFSQDLKILFVIDGAVTLSTIGFGVGKVLDILRDPAYAWWVDFEVDVAQRSGENPPTVPASPAVNPSPGPYDPKYTGFRFDQPGFDINTYDQVWFFGFHPGNDNGLDTNITLAKFTPLSNPELKIIAEWMDAGGGVFATGDHDYLGASMCYRIPRVRTMRKWTNAQGVPPIETATRYDTNQPATVGQKTSAEYMPFDVQGDSVPQPIEVVQYPLWDRFPFLQSYAPHPILCTRTGIIDVFPDHPHEGEVIAEDEVELDSPLGIAGYSEVEYPGGAGRPTPKVIAYGRSTHLQTNRRKGLLNPKRFGLIGTYDGDPVGIGRVVVDSTWHHWFSENLVGFEAANPPVMALMKQYFRNVALWLATPGQRAGMLSAATWGLVIATGPMEFPPTSPLLALGEQALDVIGRTASQCTIREWTWPYFELERFKVLRRPDPCLSCPPFDLLERTILGGITKAMIGVAFPIQQEISLGRRPVPEPRKIAAAAAQGVRLGQREAARALKEASRSTSELARAMARPGRAPSFKAPAMGVTRVRISVDEIQLLDPHDPALADSAFSLTLLVLVDDVVAAASTIDRVQVPEFDRRGGILKVSRELAEITVWRGSEVTVLVVAGRAVGRTPPADQLRGELHFAGDPSRWVGRHRAPADSQDRWRISARIETVRQRRQRGEASAS